MHYQISYASTVVPIVYKVIKLYLPTYLLMFLQGTAAAAQVSAAACLGL